MSLKSHKKGAVWDKNSFSLSKRWRWKAKLSAWRMRSSKRMSSRLKQKQSDRGPTTQTWACPPVRLSNRWWVSLGSTGTTCLQIKGLWESQTVTNEYQRPTLLKRCQTVSAQREPVRKNSLWIKSAYQLRKLANLSTTPWLTRTMLATQTN